MQVRRSELLKKLASLQKARKFLEQDYKYGGAKIISDWKNYLLLSEETQDIGLAAWNEYYRETRKGIAAEIFFQQRDAFLKNDINEVKRLAKELHDMATAGDLPMTPKPPFPDPNEFLVGSVVVSYKQIESSIKDVLNQLDSTDKESVEDIFA